MRIPAPNRRMPPSPTQLLPFWHSTSADTHSARPHKRICQSAATNTLTQFVRFENMWGKSDLAGWPNLPPTKVLPTLQRIVVCMSEAEQIRWPCTPTGNTHPASSKSTHAKEEGQPNPLTIAAHIVIRMLAALTEQRIDREISYYCKHVPPRHNR
jgi:hypothetical protein